MGLYSPKFKKWFAGLMIGWFAFVATAGFFAVQATPARAQGEPSSGGEAAEAAAEAGGVLPPQSEPGEAAETTNKFIGQYIVSGLIVSGMQVLEFALERLAHSAAKAILEGGKGRGGLFYGETAADAWETFGKEVAGEALGQLSENVVGDALDSEFDLCAPQLPRVQAGIQFSLIDTYDPPAPKCEWRNISSNWEGFVSSARDRVENPNKYLLQGLAQGFSPSQNELSASISMQVGIAGETAKKQKIDLFEQMSNDGFKNLTDAVSGDVKTPASTLKETFESRMKKAEEGKIDLAQEGLLEGAKLGQAGVGLVVNILSVFIRTLAGGWIQKALQEGLFEKSAPQDPFNPNLASLNDGGQGAAESRMVTRNPISLTKYNALGEFITCPSGPNIVNRKMNNCVMDQPFFSAVAEGGGGNALTVQEAMDQGLIHGNWPLIPPEDTVRNQDPLCYTYGYCHSNLVKLRKARIIPVGWEIAAENAVDQDGSYDELPTLKEVVENFDNCGDQSTLTDGSKWCGLIDPNWVLKYPDTQCRAETFGEILATTLGSTRGESCVDTPSCIEHDKDGNCIGGYGYCTRERNTWEFRGDACPAQYASCLSMSNTRNGQNGNFLLNTVDFSICGEGNVGCRWYRTNKYLDNGGTPGDPSDDTFQWLPQNSNNTNATEYDLETWDSAIRYDGPNQQSSTTTPETLNKYAYQDRAYFNGNVQQCSSGAAGCTEMYEVDGSLNLNLIANPSFEDDTNNDDAPDRWRKKNNANYSTDAADANFGSSSVSGSPTISWQQDSIRLAPNSFYTLSYYAKGSGSGSVNVRFSTTEGQWSQQLATDLSQTTVDADCRSLGGNTPQGWAVDASAGDIEQDTFNRFDCTFTTLSQPLLADVEIAGDSNVFYDGVQLQLGEVVTSFANGYDVSQPDSAYLRMPPDYLGCTGGPDDPDACDNYAQVCTQQDVGCNMYTPEDGDPSVPAVTNEIDNCPAECVGYTAYKQEPTKYESANIPFPQHFIADTATECSQENVGCDGFTNLEAVDAGGEGLEYYTDLRTCQKPDSTQNEATYFTWQGSEQSGYQLRTWNLLKSNQNNAPCIAGEQDSRTGISCNESGSYNNALCDETADTIINPDCREFIDEDGNSYFRQLSQTILIDEQCSTYRKNDSDKQNCVASGGHWDAATSECFYLGLAEQSDSCPAEQASCRAYTGSAGRNAATLINETFEGGTYQDFESYDNANIVISNESIATDGLSLRVANGGFETLHESISSECTQADGCEGDPNGCTIEEGATSCGLLKDTLVAGKTFTATFWAQGNGDIDVQFVDDGGTGTVHSITDGDLVTLNENWRQYTVGPLDTENLQNFDEEAVLRITPSGSNAANLFFIDNLELTQSDEVIPLIKDSWTTPSTCDQAPNGTEAPQYYLGCEAYTDQDGGQENLYQFSRLCSEEVVGCSAFYDTQNTESPYGQTYNARCATTDGTTVSRGTECIVDGESYCTIAAGNSDCTFDFPGEIPAPLPSDQNFRIELGPSAVTVSNDVPTYLVDDGTARCGAADAGCTAMGVPEYNLTRTEVQGFTENYYIDDPDTYEETLCKADALFCEEWSTPDDGNYYFKDPGKKTCEYQEGITLAGSSYSGWFRQGTNEPCYWNDNNDSDAFEILEDDAYLIGGSKFGAWNNGDAQYEGWVATCPASANQCTAFADPTDTQDGEMPNGTVYSFLNDEKMDESNLPETEKCNGSVSRKEGCVLFHNRNIPELRYSASASYMASKHADYLFGDTRFSRQDPISCATDVIVEDGAGDVDTAATWPDGEIDPPGADGPLNLCAQRCTYQTSGETTLDIPNADVFETVSGAVPNRTYATGSCVFDSDCSGYEGSDGKMYAGDCRQPATQENLFTVTDDTNEVLKVNRDRECAEWLDCKSEVPAYDKRTGEWVNKCDAIGLCTDYNREGDSTRCTAWSASEEEVLTRARYANRDVSWTGLEYSGYSIPNQLPVDQLEEVDLKEEDSDEPDVRLANMVGVCNSNDLDRGETCAVGYCQDNSGISCNTDTNCPSGDICVTSICKETTSESCSTNSDCDTQNGFVCNVGSGLCERVATDGGGDPVTCDTGSDCNIGAGEECQLAERTKVGSCINNKCVQNIAGNGVAVADNDGVLQNVEDKACRGYPEAAAPYASDDDTGIVQSWRYVEEGNDTNSIDDDSWASTASIDGVNTASAKPESLVQRYQNVNTCGLEEDGDPSDCVCSYEKIEYGGGDFGGTMTKYYGLTFDEGAELENDAAICVGGEFAGRFCSGDDECGDNGECRTPERRDTALGWEGFCLERDDSINLFNNTSKKPCLTWYPVDQLSGSTDLYAKYTEAGYEPQDTYFCSEVEDFYDLGTVQRLEDVACAESSASACGDPVRSNWFDAGEEGVEARASAKCPPGYFSIATGCESLDDDDICTDTADDDFPFFCVPKFSFHADTGEACREPALGQTTDEQPISAKAHDITRTDMVTGDISAAASLYIDIYGLTANEFRNAVEYYSDCVVRGVDHTTANTYLKPPNFRGNFMLESVEQPPESEGGNYPGYRRRGIPITSYLACSEVVQVAQDSLEGGVYNQAWTDRVWTERNPVYEIQTSPELFSYPADLSRTPFGVAMSVDEYMSDSEIALDGFPQKVQVCRDGQDEVLADVAGDQACESGEFKDRRPAIAYQNGELDVSGGTYTFNSDEFTGDALQRLQQIFTNSFDAYSWKDQLSGVRNNDENRTVTEDWIDFDAEQRGEYEVDSRGIDWFVADTGDDTDDDEIANHVSPSLPQIWSIGSCEGTKCSEGSEGAFSVDNKDEGNITGSEERYVTLRFFAAANKNQMPIRNIVADWGDGVGGVRPDTWGPGQWPSDPVGSMTNDNFYRNHRGYIGDTSQCEANNDTFAGAGRACDETYISLTNHYVCSQSLLNTYPSCQVDEATGKLLNAPCTGGDVAGGGGSCVFQPRVSVKDNWGWCTGVCPGGGDETDGCYDENLGGNNIFNPVDECNWRACPGGDECVDQEEDDIERTDPWIYYDGYVIIEP